MAEVTDSRAGVNKSCWQVHAGRTKTCCSTDVLSYFSLLIWCCSLQNVLALQCCIFLNAVFWKKTHNTLPCYLQPFTEGFLTRCVLTKDINVNYKRQQLCSHSCGWEKVQRAMCSIAFLYIECYCMCDMNGM